MKDLDLLRNRIIALERNNQSLGDTLNQVQRERDDLLAEVKSLRFGCSQVAQVAFERDQSVAENLALRRKVTAAKGMAEALVFVKQDAILGRLVKVKAALTAWEEAADR